MPQEIGFAKIVWEISLIYEFLGFRIVFKGVRF